MPLSKEADDSGAHVSLEDGQRAGSSVDQPQEEAPSCSDGEEGPIPPTASSSGTLHNALAGLSLKVSEQMQKELNDVMIGALHDILPEPLVSVSEQVIDCEEEAKMWICFAQVYSHELDLYKKQTGKEPGLTRKRQVFADILFWAEVMRPGYDQQAAQFFIKNNKADAGFQRVGKELAAAKQAKGITTL